MRSRGKNCAGVIRPGRSCMPNPEEGGGCCADVLHPIIRRSLYSGIKDIHFPHRMLFIVAVSLYMSLSFLGVGLWLGTLARGMLSEQYGFYISVLEKWGDQQVDWIKTVNQNPEKLLDLREYVVLFAARTAPLGTPFFVQMSDAVSESTVVSVYSYHHHCMSWVASFTMRGH